MGGEGGPDPLFVPDAWAADPTRATYGDVYRLDAFPWVSASEEDLPDGAAQERGDAFDGPQGRVTRHWRVTGGHGVGLPRPSERGLHLGLLMITVAAGLGSGRVVYAYRDLAAYLGLTPELKSLEQVDLALERLAGVRVHFRGTLTTTDEVYAAETLFGVVDGTRSVRGGEDWSGSLTWDRLVLESLRAYVDARRLELGPEARAGLSRAALERLLTPLLPPRANGPAPE